MNQAGISRQFFHQRIEDILYFQDADQRRVIEAKIAQFEAQTGGIVTSRGEPLGDHYNAEAYRQKLHEKHRQ